MRQFLGLVVGAGAAALGALIVGEYEFKGLSVVVMGGLFGLAIAELVVWLARPAAPWVPLVVAVLSAGGLVWAGWISVHHRHQGIPTGAYVAAGIGAAVGGLRTRAGTARSEARGSPPPQ